MPYDPKESPTLTTYYVIYSKTKRQRKYTRIEVASAEYEIQAFIDLARGWGDVDFAVVPIGIPELDGTATPNDFVAWDIPTRYMPKQYIVKED